MPKRFLVLDLATGAVDAAITAAVETAIASTAASNNVKITVDDEAARYTLTQAQVQNGDYVHQADTATLYEVIDQSMLSDATGYVALATVTAAQISDATVAGRALLTAANLAAQLMALGGGTAPTGTGALVRAISPTFTGTTLAENIQASGTVTGSNLSGTNTGDQTITLTGDVTGSGTGSFAVVIGAGRVTNAMLAGGIDLATKVTGSLAIAKGGTGATTASAARTALGAAASGNNFDITSLYGCQQWMRDAVVTIGSRPPNGFPTLYLSGHYDAAYQNHFSIEVMNYGGGTFGNLEFRKDANAGQRIFTVGLNGVTAFQIVKTADAGFVGATISAPLAVSGAVTATGLLTGTGVVVTGPSSEYGDTFSLLRADDDYMVVNAVDLQWDGAAYELLFKLGEYIPVGISGEFGLRIGENGQPIRQSRTFTYALSETVYGDDLLDVAISATDLAAATPIALSVPAQDAGVLLTEFWTEAGAIKLRFKNLNPYDGSAGNRTLGGTVTVRTFETS